MALHSWLLLLLVHLNPLSVVFMTSFFKVENRIAKEVTETLS